MALEPQAVEHLVDDAARARVRGHGGDMLGGQPGVLVPATAHGRVVAADQGHHLVLEQPCQVQLVRGLQPVAYDQVDLAQGQLGTVVGLARQRMDLYPGQRCLALDVGHQARQEQRIEVVAGGDVEGLAAGARVKVARLGEQGLGRAQHVGGGLQHALAGLGGHHVGAVPDQQRIARELAQALERRGYRRLVHAQTQRRARDAALGQHGVQHAYQVQVYAVEQVLIAGTGGRGGGC